MLIKFLTDVEICYDGINPVIEKEGTEKEVYNDLALRLINSGRAEMAKKPVEKDKKVVKKKVKDYEDKSIKSYENKAVEKEEVKKAKPRSTKAKKS